MPSKQVHFGCISATNLVLALLEYAGYRKIAAWRNGPRVVAQSAKVAVVYGFCGFGARSFTTLVVGLDVVVGWRKAVFVIINTQALSIVQAVQPLPFDYSSGRAFRLARVSASGSWGRDWCRESRRARGTSWS
jgi:hypothetical protein